MHKPKKASHQEEQQEGTPSPSLTRVSLLPLPRPNSAWFEEDQQEPVGNWRGVAVGSTRSVELLSNVQSPCRTT